MKWDETKANDLRQLMRQPGWRHLEEDLKEQIETARKRIDQYILDPKTEDKTKLAVIAELSARIRTYERFIGKPTDVIKRLQEARENG